MKAFRRRTATLLATGVLAMAGLAVVPGIAHANTSGNTSEDNFWRSNQTGFGTSTNTDGVNGITWHDCGDGTHSNCTVTGHTAQFADPGTGNYNVPEFSGEGIQHLGGDQLAEISATYSVAHGGFYLGQNFASGQASGYECRVNYNTGKIELAKRASSSTTIEASASYTLASGTKYWVRCNYDGSGHLKMRIWSPTSLEPTTWNLSWTDGGTQLGTNYSGLGNWFASTGSDTYNVFYYAMNTNAGTPATAPTVSTSGNSSESVYGASSGTYEADLGEYGSTASETAVTDNRPYLQVTSSAINQTNGSPGAFTAINTGCSAGGCNTTLLPLSVSSVETTGTVTTSATVTEPAGYPTNSYDSVYDNWYTSNQSYGGTVTEMMIWLDKTSDISPPGTEVATGVSIGGNTYNVWYNGTAPGGTVTYQFATARTSVSGLDLGPLTSDAVTRGYIGSTSWYLQRVGMGSEIWIGDAGWTLSGYKVCISGSC